MNDQNKQIDLKSVKPFKSKDEYLIAMKEDLAEWFHDLYNLEITADNFFEKLLDGIVLCNHGNTIINCMENKKLLSFRSSASKGSFQARDNISIFISWCKKELKIPDTLLFETEDLVSLKNQRSVVLCLLEVGRKGSKYGIVAPQLVQLEQEIDKEIEREKLLEEKKIRPPSSSSSTSSSSLSNKSSQISKSESKQKKNVIQIDMMTLDEMVRLILSRCKCEHQYPMIRISEGKYTYGDHLTPVFLRVLRSHVMVRTGGGWDTLESFLDRHDPCRCNSKEHRGGLAFKNSFKRASLPYTPSFLPKNNSELKSNDSISSSSNNSSSKLNQNLIGSNENTLSLLNDVASLINKNDSKKIEENKKNFHNKEKERKKILPKISSSSQNLKFVKNNQIYNKKSNQTKPLDIKIIKLNNEKINKNKINKKSKSLNSSLENITSQVNNNRRKSEFQLNKTTLNIKPRISSATKSKTETQGQTQGYSKSYGQIQGQNIGKVYGQTQGYSKIKGQVQGQGQGRQLPETPKNKKKINKPMSAKCEFSSRSNTRGITRNLFNNKASSSENLNNKLFLNKLNKIVSNDKINNTFNSKPRKDPISESKTKIPAPFLSKKISFENLKRTDSGVDITGLS